MQQQRPISVSTIIPTKGRHEFLKRAVQSILSQEMQGIEICIVDNNADSFSNTSIRNLIDVWKQTRPDILFTHIISHKQNAAAVRNEGIRASSGEFICFLDDDDVMLDKSIATRIEYLYQDPGLALVYCAAYSKIASYPFRMYRYYAFRQKQQETIDTMSCSCMIVRKSLILQHDLFFDEQLVRRHDYDFCRRVVVAGLPVKSIPKPLVLIHIHRAPRISSELLDNDQLRKNLTERWGPSVEPSVFRYAQEVTIWRQCLGIEKQSFKKLEQQLRSSFDREPTLSFKIRLRLASITPLGYLGLYHLYISIAQFYRNKIEK